jgi:protoporphyrinogen oxidase
LAAAYRLASSGRRVLVLERAPDLGGLAGSFEADGRSYPLGYHHILGRDRVLLRFLDRLGVRERVRWRRVRMLFETAGGLLDLGAPRDFLRFPLPLRDKLRFTRLMLRAYAKRDWSDWQGRSAADLVDSWASPAVREGIFEPLCRLKFECDASEVSAAWLGARLHFREGAAPLGYMPHCNWTRVLCDGMGELVGAAGADTRVSAPVAALHTRGGRVIAAELADGERVSADVFVSTVPTDAYLRLIGHDRTPNLAAIRYTALVSAVCAARAVDLPDFYWLNLSQCDSSACAVFRLDALNPTLAGPGEIILNFVTHLAGRDRPFFHRPELDLADGYASDFTRLFGAALCPRWMHISRIAAYSPIFDRSFRNPPVRSHSWANVYFAGNYRTFPSVASTGTALEAGLEAASAVLRDQAQRRSTVAAAAPAA